MPRRNKPRRNTRPKAQTETQTPATSTDDAARHLVAQGLCSPQILGQLREPWRAPRAAGAR